MPIGILKRAGFTITNVPWRNKTNPAGGGDFNKLRTFKFPKSLSQCSKIPEHKHPNALRRTKLKNIRGKSIIIFTLVIIVLAGVIIAARAVYLQQQLLSIQPSQPDYSSYSITAWKSDCEDIAPWLDDNNPTYAGFYIEEEYISSSRQEKTAKAEYIFRVNAIRFENAIYHVSSNQVNSVIDKYGNEGQILDPDPYRARVAELMANIKPVHVIYSAEWDANYQGWTVSHQCNLEK